jgi:conjugative transposon TraM protein
MKKIIRSQAFLRKRKMMLVMPLLAIPFITMAFWALGGGKGDQHTDTSASTGLNLNLPDAQLKEDNSANKLSFYDKADKDSMKLEEMMRNDPYYSLQRDSMVRPVNEIEQMSISTASKYNQRLNTSPYDANQNNPEEKLIQRLNQLQQQINTPSTKQNETVAAIGTQEDEFESQMSKLENMMQNMSEGNPEDPEMQQLSNTMDKILDIQHPQRVKDRLKEKSQLHKETVFPVTKYSREVSMSLLDTGRRKSNTQIGFYTANVNAEAEEDDNSIEAIVPAGTTLVNGAILRLRLATAIYVNGILIPRNTIISGQAALDNERLQVEINNIRYNNSLIPVKLEVFDLDGLPGIYIPGAISRDVAKQSADNSLQLLELTSLDPSLKAQAAAAGVNTVKNLLSRKVKQVKVEVKAGYRVLLRDKNIQQL